MIRLLHPATSITILVIPGEHVRPLRLRVSAIGLSCMFLSGVVGGALVSYLAVNGSKYEAEHHAMAGRLSFYSGQFCRWDSTVTGLKQIEREFRQLFSLNSAEKILESVDTAFSGSADVPGLVEELKDAKENADEIKDYLRAQKDAYMATPKGQPVSGSISSGYGNRADPVGGTIHFHSGLDIPSSPGTPIRATADGVVRHSGWTPNSGYTVVLEHGLGYSTIYAHNRKNLVKAGQRIKRGDVIAYLGSTGKSTGPHVHYEVWKDGKSADPTRVSFERHELTRIRQDQFR